MTLPDGGSVELRGTPWNGEGFVGSALAGGHECELAYTAAASLRLVCPHDECRRRIAHVIDSSARAACGTRRTACRARSST